MQAQTQIEVGDVYIIVRGESMETANVSKVSKTQFKVLASAKELTFPCNPDGGGYGTPKSPAYHSEKGNGSRRYGSRWNDHQAYHWTIETQTYVEGMIAERVESAAKKTAEKQQKRLEVENLIARELADVKEAMGGDTGLGLNGMRSHDTLPDGSRCYVVDAAINPKYADRKGGFERLIIRCKDTRELDWGASATTKEERYIDRVEMAYTYFNGNTSSFSSVSTTQHDSDADAIWEALRSQYHSW